MIEFLKAARPDLSPYQLGQFERYFELLLAANQSVNLTAITDPLDVAQKHFLDSLLPLDFSLIPQNAACIDVGTGAGFPGIPLLIARPDLTLCLLDSLKKRVAFLREVIGALRLTATAIHARAEDAAHTTEHRERYDLALSRAVAPVNVLAELTLPFVAPGGASLAYKGPGAREEIAAAKNALLLLGAKAEVHEQATPWGQRGIVVLQKCSVTPKKYPRKAGLPSKQPL